MNSNDKKYVRVIFQLEPDRHEFLKQEAEKNGVSISQYLRNLIREKFYSSRYSSMFEEQRKERVDDGFEQETVIDKIREKMAKETINLENVL
jgi:hypothetical protein